MCFTQASAVPEAPIEGSTIRASVEFSGSLSGCLEVKVGRTTAQSLATSFLGQAVRPADPLSEATVFELADVICGRFLSVLNPSAMLTIQPPARGTRGMESSAAAEKQTFQLDCGLLHITYRFDSNAANPRR
jgi:CheY-specific phosphatase CheX